MLHSLRELCVARICPQLYLLIQPKDFNKLYHLWRFQREYVSLVYNRLYSPRRQWPVRKPTVTCSLLLLRSDMGFIVSDEKDFFKRMLRHSSPCLWVFSLSDIAHPYSAERYRSHNLGCSSLLCQKISCLVVSESSVSWYLALCNSA